MDNKPKEKISIVVPVYNAEKKINRCVESLRSQIYSNIEIILINDGSTDETLAICKKYQELDERIFVIDKPNGGVSSARNAGIDVANGKYIMFCDSDDWVYEDYCIAMLEHAVQGHLIMCEFDEVTSENDCLGERDNRCDIEVIRKEEFLNYRKAGIGSPWNKLFDLDIVKRFEIKFPMEISLGEDLAFVMEYLKHTESTIVYLHRKLYVYQNEDTVSLSKRAPTIQENELFFQILSKGILELTDNDSKMILLRDQIVIQDYEKTIRKIGTSAECFWKRYKHIKKAMGTHSYQVCCYNGVYSTNIIYNDLFKKRKAILLMIYFTMTKQRENR